MPPSPGARSESPRRRWSTPSAKPGRSRSNATRCTAWCGSIRARWPRAGPQPRPWPRAERRRPAAPHDFGRSSMQHRHSPGFLAVVNAAKSRVRQFTIEEYRARVARGEKWVLVDVREDHEWDAGHLPGAGHLRKGVMGRDIGTEV